MAAKIPFHNPRPRLPRPSPRIDVLVAGAGPAGIAAVGNLLELLGESRIAWVDPAFLGGRIQDYYRAGQSNTPVNFFLDYALALEPFRNIAESTPAPNALTALQDLNPNDPCNFGMIGDMLRMLTDGLFNHDRVIAVPGRVCSANWNRDNSEWNMRVDDRGGSVFIEVPLVIYCTGASPTRVPLPLSLPRQPLTLNLDTALNPLSIRATLPRNRNICVGVVGTSCSAIHVLMNLVWLRMNWHALLSVRWFTRSKNLNYAQHKGDFIRFDKPGLDGLPAQWARENLEVENFPDTHVGNIVTRVDCSGGTDQERQVYVQEMAACDRIVQAIGYTRHPLPLEHESLLFNNRTGGFLEPLTNTPVPGLYGAGMGFPQRVAEPTGNVDSPVGFSFMRFLQKTMPVWIEETFEF
ncbi:pyridine nucleotide-disulfide oxidoreductase-domain-containing protein [Hypoxylon cercidicola]|nr:pyridine nucleotide-disulfide oxidoreductase-domain-containing protein [Hypoxylon cercidicola]